jgi:large subunit GTPase 1
MLCDCPGLVMPSFVSTKHEMVIWGILPIDQMRDHVGPVNLIASLIPRSILESTYGIFIPKPSEGEDSSRPPTSEELLNAYGCKQIKYYFCYLVKFTVLFKISSYEGLHDCARTSG